MIIVKIDSITPIEEGDASTLIDNVKLALESRFLFELVTANYQFTDICDLYNDSSEHYLLLINTKLDAPDQHGLNELKSKITECLELVLSNEIECANHEILWSV